MQDPTVSLRSFPTSLARLEYLENTCGIKLNNLKENLLEGDLGENIIGGITIPLGVAGPLSLSGLHAKGDYFIPFATTEGGLVASINRGCKAISESGGAHVFSDKVGTTRGPVFSVKSRNSGEALKKWINENTSKIKEASESTSKHLKFKKVDITPVASYVFMRFYFDTDSAMGMNMVTFATDAISKLIEANTEAKCISIAGNYDIDKKPAWLNFIEGRGFKAWGEVVIPQKVVRGTLKTTSEKIFEVWLSKCMIGSAMSGSIGFNAQISNIVAAFFAATGQDLAHVVDGSLGITIAKVVNEDLYLSVYIPSLLMGIVGGGTGRPTQNDAIKLTGVKSSDEAAEILVGAALAGELSLLASLAEGSLATAHKSLGRKK
ncbi:MAG TPA: hydroxymethylglutaryl-CoA reductase [Patescibacteria group bacterium]|nr:hydroxymethylglutaryl-CoA reductase [Patescibacteria group bacterium]